METDIDIERDFKHPRYTISKRLGQGMHSEIWEVKTESQKSFAMKRYNSEAMYYREQKMLRDIQEKLAILPIGEHFVSTARLI